ncbi:unnamed protein product [Arabidopsis thaliana]|uniref:(thale cress) hypothetical protein n=1 Tax=Arabidopsis thaliana TaxID=3702 RepID=A0A7G2FGW8_ARATH|nr:unnamed protein product [Arabidopsis thaliana]
MDMVTEPLQPSLETFSDQEMMKMTKTTIRGENGERLM